MDTHEVEGDDLLERLKAAFVPYENRKFGLPDDATQSDRDAAREVRDQEWLKNMRAKFGLPSDASETEILAALRAQFLADRNLPPSTSEEKIAQIKREESDARYVAMGQVRRERDDAS